MAGHRAVGGDAMTEQATHGPLPSFLIRPERVRKLSEMPKPGQAPDNSPPLASSTPEPSQQFFGSPSSSMPRITRHGDACLNRINERRANGKA